VVHPGLLERVSDAVVFLCGREELDKERLGYVRAFERRMPVELIAPEDGVAWRDRVRALRPRFVLNPDGRWWLPEDIERLEVPTAVFHIDTFSGTRRRILAAPLYDHVFVFHPGFTDRFHHSGARLLPHAADGAMSGDPRRPRAYEVGWVGHRGRSIYRRRDAVLDTLSARFTMNDVERTYSAGEMAELYGNSRIVVNVSRDDWPLDANMRCFEAMAAGALLVTRVPTELTELGFRAGVHFAGYYDGDDISDVVARYLARDDERLAIAERGHELVVREHTYDARVATILSAVSENTHAPARNWPPVRAWRRHFDAHVEQGDVAKSLYWFRSIRRASLTSAAASTPRLARLLGKVLRRKLLRRAPA
jgi:hypothetical protein